jgi:HEAT repeat protein
LFPILSEGIKSQNQKIRLLSCAYLGNLGLEVSFPEMVEVLENDPNQNIRAYAANGMRFIDKLETVDVLIKALGDDSNLVQVKAATTLANYKKSDAGADILVNNLNNSNDEIREDAARGLIYVTTTDAEKALCQALTNEKNPDIRYLLPFALEKHGTTTCLPILFSALQDKDDRVQRNAATAIKSIINRNTNQSIPILKKIIQDESDISHEKAKEYLQKIESSEDQ